MAKSRGPGWMNRAEEQHLISRCREGEPAAWDQLFDAYYAPAAGFVFQLGRDFSREDVEEICQEVFLSVIKNINSFTGGSRFQTWVFRIAANKASDFRDRQTAGKRGGGQTPISLQAEDPNTGLALDPPSSLPPPDLLLMNHEQADLVHVALGHVGQPCREIIELRYFGDLGYDEISEALQLNPKTVSSRLSKCLDKLEEAVKKLFAGEPSRVFPSNQ